MVDGGKAAAGKVRVRESVREQEADNSAEGHQIEAEIDPVASQESWKIKGLMRRMWIGTVV